MVVENVLVPTSHKDICKYHACSTVTLVKCYTQYMYHDLAIKQVMLYMDGEIGNSSGSLLLLGSYSHILHI